MQGRRKLTVTFTADMLAKDYTELKSCIKIAQKYGVSKKCILNYMNRFGIKRHHSKPPVAEVKRLGERGLSAPEIALYLGVTSTYISQIARKIGLKLPDKYHTGKIQKTSGHILIRKPDHPHHDCKGYGPEHRYKMEQAIGCILPRQFAVHHINQDPSDNRLNNLAIMTHKAHKMLHRALQLNNQRTSKTAALVEVSPYQE